MTTGRPQLERIEEKTSSQYIEHAQPLPPQKLVQEINDFKKETLRSYFKINTIKGFLQPKNLTQEIKDFKKETLNPVVIYYSSRTIDSGLFSKIAGFFGARIHGSPILVSKPKFIRVPNVYLKPFYVDKNKKTVTFIDPDYATRPFYATTLYASYQKHLAPFSVTRKLIEKANELEKLPKPFKDALAKMEGQNFPSGETFFRALYKERDKLVPKDQFSESRTSLLAANPPTKSGLMSLLYLNVFINNLYGAIFPYLSTNCISNEDSSAFVSKKVTATAWHGIKPTTAIEKQQQYSIQQHFCEAKAGVADSYTLLAEEKQEEKREDKKSTQKKFRSYRQLIKDEELKSDEQVVTELNHYKNTIDRSNTQSIISRLAQYAIYPHANTPLKSSCNKTTATMMQAWADHDGVPVNITGASKTSFGSSTRMKLWEPVPPPNIIKLISDPRFEITNPKLLQHLADNKGKILQDIQRFVASDKEKIRVYLRILDRNTNLGKIFFKRRSWCFRQPHESRGFLLEVRKALAKLEHRNLRPEKYDWSRLEF